MKHTNKKGFTIVELVIVIAVIAILAAVLIPTFSNLIKKANESSDVQAVRQMNTFLTTEAIIGEVNSILDVYDIFRASGYTIENYTPIVDGNEFYYDTTLKQILYVELATGKVLFPKEYEGQTKAELGHVWLSLSMSINVEEITPVVADGVATYTVSKAGQYAYVVEQLNQGFTNNVVVNLETDLDFNGAMIAIEEIPADKSFTLNGNGKTMKNITANTFSDLGTGKDSERKYIAAGLVGEANGQLSITNIVLENITVKETNTGNVALVVGYLAGTKEVDGVEVELTQILSNITIKNSTVIGHRSVGAVVGMLYDDVEFSSITLENVSVQTIAGRSGLLFGFASMNGRYYSVTNLVNTYSTLSIYECDQNKGEGCAIVDYAHAGTHDTNATKQITSYSVENNGGKAYRTYGFNENALGCVFNPNSMTIGETTKPVDNWDYVKDNNPYQYCYFRLPAQD